LYRVVKRPKEIQDPGEKFDLGEGGEKMQQGLAKLTLSVMEILRMVLERQALRRIDSGSLAEQDIERMGLAFMQLRKEMTLLAKSMGLGSNDLNEVLGSLLKTADGSLGTGSIVDILDRLLERGAVVAGQLKVSVADVDLVGVDVLAMLYPIYGERRWLDDKPVAPNDN
jgi:hypothetical protein